MTAHARTSDTRAPEVQAPAALPGTVIIAATAELGAASGTYVARLRAAKVTVSHKMQLLKVVQLLK